jgi:cyclophilin family peptidyl-prolyl cis-trans isomerase
MHRIALGLLLLFATSSCQKHEQVATPAQPPAQPSTKPQADTQPPSEPTNQPEIPMAKSYKEPADQKIDANKKYTATIETDAGTMTAELYPKIAPQTVNAFVFLAREGFYEGVIFHRVIPGFMIQGGDPTGTGTGGPGYKLKAEFNDLKHDKGVLSMARTADPNSAGSQFFIMHDRSPHLDRQYTGFGKVTSGTDVIDKIATAPKGAQDRPNQPVKIKKITITEE